MFESVSRPNGCNPLCRACRHIELSAGESQKQKASWLNHKLSSWEQKILPLIAPDDDFRLGYRTRSCLSTAFIDGRWVAGLIQDEEILPIPGCPLHHPSINAFLEKILAVMPEQQYWPLAYLALYGKQLTFILKTPVLPDLGWFSNFFRFADDPVPDYFPEGVWLHLHPSAGNRIFLKYRWEHIWGKKFSLDEENLAYGPVTFRQVIPGIHKAAVEMANSFLSPSAGDVIADLCCGNGGTLRRWTEMGAYAIGIELSGEAVNYARINAPGAMVLRGKCSERIPQLKELTASANGLLQDLNKGVKVFANPPRTGLEPNVIEWIKHEALIQKIAYLSCSAGTLSRDLIDLQSAGFRVVMLQPYDFFPYTHHVEVLALLTRDS